MKSGVGCLIGRVSDLAFLKLGDGPYVCGRGPFRAMSSPPSDAEAVFYVNDFMLLDPKPWKQPSEVLVVDDLNELGVPSEEAIVEWDNLEPEGFAEVFAEINEMISRGVMEKSVPVATERGRIAQGNAESFLSMMAHLDEPFYSYGWCTDGESFCGATPELLFTLRGQDLSTMALAGTAKSDERDVFAVDGKEIREHEFVAQTLVAKLSDIGEVHRERREMLDLGQLVHFHTAIEVKLFAQRQVDELIRRLHPTPALGPLPRTSETMQHLAEWRERLGCPPYFGAPFGLQYGGEFHSVVTIRGIHWSGKEVAIPSGCGVIEASRLVNEWRELRLKRDAVKDWLGF